ncbi:MAG: hypothetical protein KJ706_03685 [Candidatus Omnitrophica bacterium]|nr:hypothetical protein [Candidatus Omnitrophota bacterium]
MSVEIVENGNADYTTSEIKLIALLLSEIPQARFEVLSNCNLSKKKLVKVIYPSAFRDTVDKLINEFIERRAHVGVYQYNRNLNRLRDAVKLCN